MHVRLGSFFACLVVTMVCVTVVAGLSQPIENSDPKGSEYSDQALRTTTASIEPALYYKRCLAGLHESSEESQKPPVLGRLDNPATTEAGQIQLVTYIADDSTAGNRNVVYWPKPKQLVEQIEALKEIPQAEPWATATLDLLERASQLEIDSPELDEILSQLNFRQQQVRQIATAVWNSKSTDCARDSSQVARMGYRMSRRLEVWQAARQISTHAYQLGDDSDPNDFVSYRKISFDNLDSRWVDYLQLEEFRKSFESVNPDREEQKKTARQVLARIYSPVLQREQAEFIRSIMDPSIIEFLKEQATESVDVSDLLTRLERYEVSPSSFTGYYLNDQYQNLLWSGDPADQALAAQIHTHYRNANFRLAVSERLLNRMIPTLPATAMPVSENVQGARVSGQSHVTNQLRVSLVPDPSRLMLSLETAGHVQSDTVARTKTFRILNQGEARFHVLKRLAIGRDGIDASHRPVSSSSANQYVVGVESNLDKLPILGWMARKLAVKKLKEQAPETDRLFREKVETSAESRVQQELDEQLVKLRQYTYTNLLQPLLAMDLEPEPLQMATTDNQLVMRYRLAGRDQMAANTARPRDNGNSLLSFQMHQSTVNNAIARIGLNGNVFTTEELKVHLQEVFGTNQIGSDSPVDGQQGAKFGFAHFDPIRVDFSDNRIKITLNLRSLQIEEKGKTWKNLSLTAAYQVNTEGMQIFLEQDDLGTRIKGKRLRLSDKAAMSTVMKVLFEQHYSVNALPKGLKEKIGGPPLEVTQLVVSNGWLGVSVEDGLPPIEQAESIGGQRTGTIRRLMNRR